MDTRPHEVIRATPRASLVVRMIVVACAALMGGCTDNQVSVTRDATVDTGPLRGLRPNGADGGTWVPGAYGDASTTLGSGFDLRCCCFGDCPEGLAGCLTQYFVRRCNEGASTDSCVVAPLTPTTDPTQVHPFWFLAHHNGSEWVFSGFSIPCQDVVNF